MLALQTLSDSHKLISIPVKILTGCQNPAEVAKGCKPTNIWDYSVYMRFCNIESVEAKEKKVGRRKSAELLLDPFRKIKPGQKVIMILRIALAPLRWLLLRKFCLTGDNDHVANVIFREILLFLLLLIVRIVYPRRYNTFS